MSREIAVYVGPGGETASLKERGRVVVYRNRSGRWEVSREKAFSPGESMCLKDLRGAMVELVEFLGDCKIFVGLSVTGIPYYELEKHGLRVWEFQGRPEEYLDFILAKEEEECGRAAGPETGAAPPVPVEISGGRYRISLKEIQESNGGLTSKQVLLPFVRRGEFYSLEVLCNHLPPWLEAELLAGGLTGEVEHLAKDLLKVTIVKQCCN